MLNDGQTQPQVDKAAAAPAAQQPAADVAAEEAAFWDLIVEAQSGQQATASIVAGQAAEAAVAVATLSRGPLCVLQRFMLMAPFSCTAPMGVPVAYFPDQ